MPPPCAQWIAIPTKSVCALVLRAFGGCRNAFSLAASAFEAAASFHSGVAAWNTWVMSPNAPVPVFSSSMLAVETPPKSHPARVNGTHGAGVVFAVPESPLTMFGRGSRAPVESSTRSVQYLKEVLKAGLLAGVLVGSK